MKLFDCNACFGNEMINHECVNHENFIVLEQVELAKTAEELLGYMDYVGIEKSMVWHRSQYELDAAAGNRRTLEELKVHLDRLIPTWTLLPSITDETFRPEVFFPEMKRNGVKALRAFPDQDRYLLCEVTMGEQLRLLCEMKIPLFLSPMSGYEYIYTVLKEFPDLTVVLANIGWWPSARLIYPLLARYPNVYFETGDFSMLRGYEEVCGKFGSERILFGTNFPTNSMSGSIYSLMTADITEEERENIAYRNLERLLDEVKL